MPVCEMDQARQVMRDHHRGLGPRKDPRHYLLARAAEAAGECAVICDELAIWPGFEVESATYMDRAFGHRCRQLDLIQSIARLLEVTRGR